MTQQNRYQSNILQDKIATLGIMNGIKIVADVIRGTYGGAGTNVIVESRLYPYHGIYNDAQTIVQAIRLSDPAEKRGLAFCQELCDRADKLSGDSRKTTLLLMDAILQEGSKADIGRLNLKRELDAIIPVIENEINKQTKQITVDEVGFVATTASENEETGKLLQEIYQKIGKDGIIHVEGSGTFHTSYKFIEGVRFDMTGYLSPYMIHDEQARNDKVKETKAIYENPLILVTKKKIMSDDDINPLLNELAMSDKRDLVIFTQDMDSAVATMLVELHRKGTFNILIIKAPTLWREYIFEDFAKCVGATIIEDASGKTFKNISPKDLGTCGKIIVDQDETILIGTQDISDHITYLKSKGDEDSKLRLAWLTNKTAILKLGSNSETDLSYKRLKCNDAVRSSQLALKYGIVKGGGITLKSIAQTLPDSISGQIMKKALEVPYNQNMANFGEEIEIRENIVDAAAVVKNAVRNAIGIASTILTANALIYLVDKPQEEKPYAF